MECQRNNTYSELLCKAAAKIEIPFREGYFVFLIKVAGSLIKDEDITINGVNKPWSLGRYLQLLKKSPSSLKIGLAVEDSSSQMTELVIVIVTYLNHNFQVRRGLMQRKRVKIVGSLINHDGRGQ